jgi:tetraacyldisaccharide 4'-kinase
LRRAGALVLTRKSATAEQARDVEEQLAVAARGKPVAICHLAADRLVPLHGGEARSTDSLAGCDVLAVAALAHPEPFFAALGDAGAQVEAAAYPDHHPFSASDARRIGDRAAGRVVVMTHKDAVKLRSLLPSSPDFLVLEQAVRVEAGLDALDAALRRALEAKRE